ncbi:unnamed protein product [Staurois parvus]|uniref:Uncharacterized protein n=1 Tax=Staurois parvus TaxID=386267 RepID=A0ABN9DVY1_9NEOB|nr:unnamed protein product [Staurois parvus]
MRPLGNRGSWGPYVLAHTQTIPKKAYERYQEHLMGPPTDPGPSGSAEWSVRPCLTPSAGFLKLENAYKQTVLKKSNSSVLIFVCLYKSEMFFFRKSVAI